MKTKIGQFIAAALIWISAGFFAGCALLFFVPLIHTTYIEEHAPYTQVLTGGSKDFYYPVEFKLIQKEDLVEEKIPGANNIRIALGDTAYEVSPFRFRDLIDGLEDPQVYVIAPKENQYMNVAVTSVLLSKNGKLIYHTTSTAYPKVVFSHAKVNFVNNVLQIEWSNQQDLIGGWALIFMAILATCYAGYVYLKIMYRIRASVLDMPDPEPA